MKRVYCDKIFRNKFIYERRLENYALKIMICISTSKPSVFLMGLHKHIYRKINTFTNISIQTQASSSQDYLAWQQTFILFFRQYQSGGTHNFFQFCARKTIFSFHILDKQFIVDSFISWHLIKYSIYID